ncbi:hypothetical protein PHYSODRAFT_257231 [Phytophthora sojae]|uniref:RRM Nup35-type domain-containing protein n=1 Tax=Phytophthora sojae (strain P6497) TaxID=1094619 RepID=G4ZSR4_PHYSP|nr:hypothetical protein PHYSODRAFT_257231 [Phytophthora sojae]EGZ12785.1 hypothetical protein PHYSODRAFT_257231 [Phytophthora sojae]|eukprot:XP_009530214.1 hypothetical protein PHYSODRAFT_257231 [Phytophthora sojae]
MTRRPLLHGAVLLQRGRRTTYPNVHGVTVFGFQSSAKSFILHQFQSVNEVVNYSSSSGDNWLHLPYDTRLQVEKALSYDGRTLANDIMIRVKKCYPSDRDANALNETPVSSYFGAPELGLA